MQSIHHKRAGTNEADIFVQKFINTNNHIKNKSNLQNSKRVSPSINFKQAGLSENTNLDINLTNSNKDTKGNRLSHESKASNGINDSKRSKGSNASNSSNQSNFKSEIIDCIESNESNQTIKRNKGNKMNTSETVKNLNTEIEDQDQIERNSLMTIHPFHNNFLMDSLNPSFQKEEQNNSFQVMMENAISYFETTSKSKKLSSTINMYASTNQLNCKKVIQHLMPNIPRNPKYYKETKESKEIKYDDKESNEQKDLNNQKEENDFKSLLQEVKEHSESKSIGHSKNGTKGSKDFSQYENEQTKKEYMNLKLKYDELIINNKTLMNNLAVLSSQIDDLKKVKTDQELELTSLNKQLKESEARLNNTMQLYVNAKLESDQSLAVLKKILEQ